MPIESVADIVKSRIDAPAPLRIKRLQATWGEPTQYTLISLTDIIVADGVFLGQPVRRLEDIQAGDSFIFRDNHHSPGMQPEITETDQYRVLSAEVTDGPNGFVVLMDANGRTVWGFTAVGRMELSGDLFLALPFDLDRAQTYCLVQKELWSLTADIEKFWPLSDSGSAAQNRSVAMNGV